MKYILLLFCCLAVCLMGCATNPAIDKEAEVYDIVLMQNQSLMILESPATVENLIQVMQSAGMDKSKACRLRISTGTPTHFVQKVLVAIQNAGYVNITISMF